MKPVSARNSPTIALRRVAPPDEPFLLRLYAFTRAAELATTAWDEATRADFIRGQFHARRADYARRYPSAESSIILIENRETGIWIVDRAPKEIRLVNIEIIPDMQRRGLATILINSLRADAQIQGLPLTLSVRDDNVAAARHYRRLGFAVTGREAGYIQMQITA